MFLKSVTRISAALVLILVALPVTLGLLTWAYSLFLRQDTNATYPPPGRMLTISSQRMHLDCSGQAGDRTVIFEAGAGTWSTHWQLVHNLLPETIRACSYDRAGLGWSERNDLPRNDQQLVNELSALLQHSGEVAPYIMVGWSAGGPLAWLYAQQNPEEVAGVVMVDSITESYLQWSSENTSTIRHFVRNYLRPFLVLQGIAQSVLLPPELDSPSYRNFTDFQLEVLRNPGFRSRMVAPAMAENGVQEDLGYMSELGDIPLVVVEAGRVLWPMSEIQWHNGQQQLLASSSLSSYLVADQVAHNIPIDGPEYVVSAIQRIIDML